MLYTSIEICAGAGGQAVGLEAAGFDHLACVEIDPAACATLRHNRPGWNVVQADVREWEPDPALRGEVDLLAGGVPCPPFSIAGHQLGRDDERDLFPEMLRLAEALDPRSVMIENVRGIAGRKFDEYRAEIVTEFKEMGYEFCGWEVLDAADYGVPQTRPRAILIVMKPDVALHFRWPEPRTNRVMIGETLKNLMGADGWEGATDWAERADAAGGIAPALVGGSKKHGGADLGPTRARAAWAKLGVDGLGVDDLPPQPGRTALPKLTVPMAAAVQGFPQGWEFMGRKTAAYRQVGNAFPPPVAEAIGQRLTSAFTCGDTA